ncbi:MAG TPA: aldose epimerase family protein [Croceibacterium sp.]|nr:aldose epimerase family protein [Solirubrobacterales bacterium]HYD23437.1 aldose epimerase family protein [Croceibacterium sp.]
MKQLVALAVGLAASCAPAAIDRAGALAAEVGEAGLDGIADDDAEIREYVLRNGAGTVVRFLNYGAVITAIETAGRDGGRANVVLGYGSESEYRRLNGKNYFGAVVGRYAGRIRDARFTLDGREVRLEPNLAGNALHGGAEPGIAFKLWQVRPFQRGDVVGAVLTLVDPAGAQRFPGELSLQVTYSLLPDDALRIDYAATTSAATVLNLTNHTYFNLAGGGSVADHRLRLVAGRYAATDAEDIPTGAFPPVAGTVLDFRQPRRVGDRFDDPSPLLAGNRGGYNHSWVLDKPAGSLALAATLADPASGRTLAVETTEPSLHAYTAEYFDGEDVSATGAKIPRRGGIALETQHFSDSPNRPEFPSTVLRPGETYRSTTIWRFATAR